MAKRSNTYRLTLEPVALANGESPTHEPLQFEFENHDELFSIIERLRQKNPFDDPQQATEFAIGLKLFSEVMIRNRNHPFFEELMPAFRTFMEKVKK